MPINRRSKEIAVAGESLLCDRYRTRSPPTNTNVGLSLCNVITDRPKNGNPRHVGAVHFYVALALALMNISGSDLTIEEKKY